MHIIRNKKRMHARQKENPPTPSKEVLTRHSVMLSPSDVKRAKKLGLNVSLIARKAMATAIKRKEKP